MVDWSKFDEKIDIDGMKKDIEDAKDNKMERVDIPAGKYDVKVASIECKESKAGDPMVTIRFKILDGEYEGLSVWMNQVITKGFQIHIVNEMLRTLVSMTDIEVTWESYEQYEDLLNDIFEAIDDDFEYRLEYGMKGTFPTFKILEVYDAE